MQANEISDSSKINVYSKSMVSHGEDVQFEFHTDDYLIAGVADGHGGNASALLCKNNIYSIMTNYLSTTDMRSLIENTFSELHKMCLELPCNSGCTLTVVIVHKKTREYFCGNVGDSLAIHVKPSSHMWITTSHRLQDNPSERERLKGKISYIKGSSGDCVGPPRLYPGGLSCSRSLGDADCVHIVCTPSIYSDILGTEDSIVVCTDGIWDSTSYKKILNCARSTINPDYIVRSSTRYSDDATALIITFKKIKNSYLFNFFHRTGSNSSFSSEDEATPTVFKVNTSPNT